MYEIVAIVNYFIYRTVFKMLISLYFWRLKCCSFAVIRLWNTYNIVMVSIEYKNKKCSTWNIFYLYKICFYICLSLSQLNCLFIFIDYVCYYVFLLRIICAFCLLEFFLLTCLLEYMFLILSIFDLKIRFWCLFAPASVIIL